MRLRTYLQNGLIGATAALIVGSRFVPGTEARGPIASAAASVVSGSGPVLSAAADLMSGRTVLENAVLASTRTALVAFSPLVQPLSHPKALEAAFRSYFAYRAAHPEQVKKPYLYFVDYGQPSTTPRGYLFDMKALTIVDGPFTVAHGRGSSRTQFGVPRRFSNRSGSASTSLGLYLTQETYRFVGHAAGGVYSSIGLRLKGLSGGFNDNARARGVVAHGAPYVTPTRAGRSLGCPAVEPARAKRMLPEIANGSLVFLFAPDSAWMHEDPWMVATTAE